MQNKCSLANEGEKKMAKTLEDFKTFEPAFPEAENMKTEDFVGQTIKLKAVQRRIGEKGSFYVVLAETENKRLVSFATGGLALTKWIRAFIDGFKLKDEEEKINVFPEEIEVVLVKKKSKTTGMGYYEFVNS